MSLARRAIRASTRSATIIPAQLRLASSSAHEHHDDHHQEHHDSTVYPQEGFGNKFWRNVVLVSLCGVAAYKYAPKADDSAYLTRWIAMYTAPRDYWLLLNAKHTGQQMEVSEATLLMTSAERPTMHKFRYPQSLVQGSAFLNPVGMGVDMKDVVLKNP
ncbi:hypothetical protein B0H34DRAFT_699064 [Crassisporium funariophilum]|nr:hypothetical protein B0H34DRAFT_699064 [Crassisporium funariophilum]